jgi:soluble lytic murein transglycosylase-like protein
MVPFNAGDELMAGIRSAVDYTQGKPWQESYDSNLDEIRGYQEGFRADHPVAAPLTAIAGSAPLVMAAPTGISAELSFMQKLGQSAVEGAGWGGAYGFGAGEGGLENRTVEAAKQALAGELISPVATGGLSLAGWLASLPGKAADGVGALFRTSEEIAANRLQPSASKILNLADDPGNPLSQYRTLAEATQDPYLAQLEQQVGKSSPSANTLLTENTNARRLAQLEELTGLSDVAPRGQSEGGVALRQLLEPEAVATKTAADDIFKSISPGGKIPVEDVASRYNNTLSNIYEAGGAPGALTGIQQEVNRAAAPKVVDVAESALLDQFGNRMIPPEVAKEAATKPFSYMHSLRMRAQDAWTAAKAVGDTRAAKVANDLVRDIDGVIEGAGKSGAMSKADTALFTKAKKEFTEFARTYQDGPVGIALRKMGEGNYQVPESALPRMIFNGRAENTQKFLKAIPDTPAALQEGRAIYRDRILRETAANDVTADGVQLISPGKFRTFLRKEREGLTAATDKGKRLFDDDHILALDQIAEDAAFLDPSSAKSVKQLANAASAGQPTTAQALIAEMADKGGSFVPGFGVAKKLAGSVLESKRIAANDLIARAITDKSFAKALLLKATPERVGVLQKFLGAADGSAKLSRRGAASAPAFLAPLVSEGSQAFQFGQPAQPNWQPERSTQTPAPNAQLGLGQQSQAGIGSSPNSTSVFSKTQPLKPSVFTKLSKAVERVESGGKADAVSSKGAIGTHQVMPIAMREVMRSQGVDDKQFTNADLTQMAQQPGVSKEYGEAYLNILLAKYDGDIELALAAYNAGPTAVSKLLKGDAETYADIRSKLPAETRNYVPRVKSIFEKA